MFKGGKHENKKQKAKTKRVFPFSGCLFHLDFTKKYLSHSYFYKVAGEDLPERHEKRWIAKTVTSLISFTVLFFVIGYIVSICSQFIAELTAIGKQTDLRTLFLRNFLQ